MIAPPPFEGDPDDPYTTHVWREVQAVIDYGLAATRDKDLNRYMNIIPPGIIVELANGERLGREDLREHLLEQWEYVSAMLEVHMEIESLEAVEDRAVVYTAQRYRRRVHFMLGGPEDELFSTRRHRGRWQRLPVGWRCVMVVDLGGETYVNGRCYDLVP